MKTGRVLVVRGGILGFAAMQLSCGDGTGPRVATTLTARTPTSIIAIAGDRVIPIPAVIVSDQDGERMAGVIVAFAVTAGQGTITGTFVVTNSYGYADVGSWTLDPKVGFNSLTATADGMTPVVFTATGLPGPPAKMILHDDNQIAAVGNPVPIPPSVTLTDTNDNVVPGVKVIFSPGFGQSGTVTEGIAITDGSGLAAVGSWTLGQLGTNQLIANAPGGVSATFNAEGAGPCNAPRPLAFGSTFNGFLSISDCHLDNGRYGDFTQTTATGSFRVTLTTSSFDPRLFVDSAYQTPIAENASLAGSRSASVRIIGRSTPFTYIFVASSVDYDKEGPYTLTTTPVSTSVTNCEEVFITREASTSQNVEATDCVDASLYDRYTIYLKAGKSVTISMTAGGFEKNLELFDPAGNRVSVAGANGSITYTPTEPGYYQIRAGSAAENQTGAYTLSIN